MPCYSHMIITLLALYWHLVRVRAHGAYIYMIPLFIEVLDTRE